MSDRRSTQTVLDELAKHYGLPHLTLDDDARQMALINGMPVTFVYEDAPFGLLWLYVDIEAVPDGADQLCGVLRYGFATWIAKAMTIGVDDSGTRLIGFIGLAAQGLTTELARAGLDQLLEASAALRERLTRGEIGQFGAEAPAQQPGDAVERRV